ncbi:glycosyltransferase [Halomonas alimentaria]|uniref:glycosyltransferase n=1 Tax=Halomonas alimentaria TaxID=147248 RepID=UPI002492F9F4|nr:glycosyltransferase [Halomonas alimentaria]
MKRIAFVVAAPATAQSFLCGHIAELSKCYEVDLIANFSEGHHATVPVKNKIHSPIHRGINLWFDLIGLISLIITFTRKRYHAIHSVTPKAGLLAMLAAWVTCVPVRHHTFTGQVWATRKGFSRWLLRLLDRLVHGLSTYSLVDSHSQREFLLKEKVLKSEKSSVLLSGSISGVDIERFKPDSGKRETVRSRYGILASDFVFLFLGRINAEKGVPELLSAFRSVSSVYPSARLMVVGSDEAGMFTDGAIEMAFAGKLVRVDYTREPEAYFNAADVVCLPSHREGFGSVLIEAAACGVSSIASNIYGISDAVIDGQTGLLHTARSEEALTEKMLLMIGQPGLRSDLERRAMHRARTQFAASSLEQALVEFYNHRMS